MLTVVKVPATNKSPDKLKVPADIVLPEKLPLERLVKTPDVAFNVPVLKFVFVKLVDDILVDVIVPTLAFVATALTTKSPDDVIFVK